MAGPEDSSRAFDALPGRDREREGVLRDTRQGLQLLRLAPAGGDAPPASLSDTQEAAARTALARLSVESGISDGPLSRILRNPSFVGMSGMMLQDLVQSVREIRELPALGRQIAALQRNLDRNRQRQLTAREAEEIRLSQAYLDQLSYLIWGRRATTLAFALDAGGDAIEMVHAGLTMGREGARGLGKFGQAVSALETKLSFGPKVKLAVPYLYLGATIVQNLAILQSGRVEATKITQVQEYVREHMEHFLSADERAAFAQEMRGAYDTMVQAKTINATESWAIFALTCVNPWLGIGVGLTYSALTENGREAQAWLAELSRSATALSAGFRLHPEQAHDYLARWSALYEDTPLYRFGRDQIVTKPENSRGLGGEGMLGSPEQRVQDLTTPYRYVDQLRDGRKKVIRAYLTNAYRVWAAENGFQENRTALDSYIEAGMRWFAQNRPDFRAAPQSDARWCLERADLFAREVMMRDEIMGLLPGVNIPIEKQIDQRTWVLRLGSHHLRVHFPRDESWAFPEFTFVGRDMTTPVRNIPEAVRMNGEHLARQLGMRIKYNGIKIAIATQTPTMRTLYEDGKLPYAASQSKGKVPRTMYAPGTDAFDYAAWFTSAPGGYWNIVRCEEHNGRLRAMKYFVSRGGNKIPTSHSAAPTNEEERMRAKLDGIMEYGSVEGLPLSANIFIPTVHNGSHPRPVAEIIADVRSTARRQGKKGLFAFEEDQTYANVYFRVGDREYKAWFDKRDPSARGIELSVGTPRTKGSIRVASRDEAILNSQDDFQPAPSTRSEEKSSRSREDRRQHKPHSARRSAEGIEPNEKQFTADEWEFILSQTKDQRINTKDPANLPKLRLIASAWQLLNTHQTPREKTAQPQPYPPNNSPTPPL